ncbi:integrase domain protein SAM domain protein [Leptolyngbya sp. NIES-3755]|nr:integrase domain protein SAM domain protein [Leptolyngbya sp. NIES-3755]
MTTPKLNFFESPHLPTPTSPTLKRPQLYLPDLKEPPPDDLRWTRVEQWLAAKSLAQNTKRSYTRELKRFWNWTNKPWNQVTIWDVTRYKEYLETALIQESETNTLKRQLSPNSVALAVRSLKSFFRWMEQAHYIIENPTLAVSVPTESEPESKELTDLQVQALYAALERRGHSQLRDTALLATLSHGLRAEEASHLNVEDYDGRRLHIREAKQGSTGRVPLDQDACNALNAYLEWRKGQGESLTADTPLFVNYSRDPRVRGRRLSYDGIYLVVKQLGQMAIDLALEQIQDKPEARSVADLVGWEIAVLAEVYPHQLRHTFASNLVLGGMDAYLAMSLTRHRSVSVFKRYSNKAREKQAEQAFRGHVLDLWMNYQTDRPNS